MSIIGDGFILRRTAVAVSVLSLLLAGCGNRPGASQGGEAQASGGVVELVMAPDPVWKWLEDKGIKAEMEKESGVTINTSQSWDEYGAFAGGHADVVSTASYEVPELEKQTGEPITVFGKYNADRTILAVGADSTAQNLCDLKGKRIVTYSAVAATIMWGVFARKFCDLDLRPGGGDYELVVVDPQNEASLLERGDVDAGILIPDFSIPQLMKKTVKPLYDSRAVAQIYAQDLSTHPDDVTHPQTNVFAARKAWVEKNPKEAAFVVEIWNRGVREWAEHKSEIIAAYPEDFAATTPEERAFIENWINTKFDWFVDTTYIDQTWADRENKVIDLMKETGFVEKNVPAPNFTVLERP
jgi:ABC-type nitrate/sulfonate/bicarbonate transport system substrate-binding protein